MSVGSTQNLNKTPLKIYTLGQFVVRYGDHVLSEDCSFSKPWQLFLYLITHREKPAPPEVMLETLWLEQEYANPKKALHNLVHRLKQELGVCKDSRDSPIISISQGCYRLNDGDNVWLDVKSFETLCHEAYKLKEADPSLAIEKYQGALALYHGDYLSECPATEWIVPTRRYYHHLLMKSVPELLGLLKKARLFSEITTVCEKMFLIDLFEEDPHLSYMEALLENGKAAKARAHYQYITSALYQEIGVSPSDAMRRLYRALKTEGAKSHPEFNDIQEILQQREKAEGALLCESEIFRFLCKLERRRAAREGYPVHIGLLTLTAADLHIPLSADLGELTEFLKKILMCSLRKGDVVSQLNESQCVVLLAGQDQEQSEKILSRLRKRFVAECTKKEVILRRSVHPLLSWDT